MIDPIISTAAALALSVILASAASNKLRKPNWFRRQVEEYQLAPSFLTPVIALGLPVVELLAAVGLLWTTSRSYAAAAALTLVAAYALAIGINLLRGRHDMDCGCSGPAMHQPLHPMLLLRNLFLGVLALGALLPVLERTLSLHDNFVMIAAGIVAVLLYAAADLWLANRSLLLKLSGDK
ncbi:MauE/DoxX family redox-associated membrane protein [Marinobacter subterrani]|uniref:MauE/DoxX family redox-associated membrane protein n=1 Tax=Marinobacter subterrani TaxID=1658765 RepID=UPI0023543407|nr:MauE/DoxX family redox-associated membrane protein [Marinobacter subterrani]